MGKPGGVLLKRPAGFTMAELMIVLSVIGILASISLPLFLEQKDKVIAGVTRANLDAARTSLSQYAARSPNNTFPRGRLGYFDFRSALPETKFPPIEADAKFMSGSFLYSSDGATYFLRATSINRTSQRFLALPSGILRE